MIRRKNADKKKRSDDDREPRDESTPEGEPDARQPAGADDAAEAVEDGANADLDAGGGAEVDAGGSAGDRDAEEFRAEDESPERRIAQLEAERDEALGQYHRALADYRNFQRRSSQNEVLAAERARQEFVRDLLPILDQFDLALEHAERGEAQQILQGVRMVRDGLMQLLAQRKVAPIRPEPGEEFDPNRHEAMMMEPTDEVEPNRIVRMIQIGYAMGDTVLRPAKVVIARAPSEEESGGGGGEDAPNPEAGREVDADASNR